MDGVLTMATRKVSTMTTNRLAAMAALATLGLLLARTARAQGNPVNQAKVNAGAHVVEKAPAKSRAPAATKRAAAYPLTLQVFTAANPHAAANAFVTGQGEQLVLLLELANHGAANEFSLHGITWAMDGLLPNTVSVAPGATNRVEVRLLMDNCKAKATFFDFVARPLEPG